MVSRLVSIDSFLDGQCGGNHLKWRRSCACSPSPVKVDGEFKFSVSLLLRYLYDCSPRFLKSKICHRYPLLFRDACRDSDLVGVGVVLFIGVDIFFFGGKLSLKSIGRICNLGFDRFIALAELTPVPLAIYTFLSFLISSMRLAFIDNDSARGALIRGWSSRQLSTDDIYCTQRTLSDHRIGFWAESVPSISNYSDGPPRGCYQELLNIGAVQVGLKMPNFPDFLTFGNFD